MRTEILEHLKSTVQPVRLDQFLKRMQELGYKFTEARWEVLQLIADEKVAFGTNVYLWTTETKIGENLHELESS